MLGSEIGVRGGEAISSNPFEISNFVADAAGFLWILVGMEKLRGMETGGAGNGVGVCDAAGSILVIAWCSWPLGPKGAE